MPSPGAPETSFADMIWTNLTPRLCPPDGSFEANAWLDTAVFFCFFFFFYFWAIMSEIKPWISHGEFGWRFPSELRYGVKLKKISMHLQLWCYLVIPP